MKLTVNYRVYAFANCGNCLLQSGKMKTDCATLAELPLFFDDVIDNPDKIAWRSKEYGDRFSMRNEVNGQILKELINEGWRTAYEYDEVANMFIVYYIHED